MLRRKRKLTCDEGGQFGEGLFSGAADTDKHQISTRVSDHARNLDEVDDGVREEHEVHV